MRITFYKNSFLANVVNILGYLLLIPGIVMLIAGISDFIISVIIIGIVLIVAGFGCTVLAAGISARKAASKQAVTQKKAEVIADKNRSVKMVFQRKPAEGGVASLCMILDYYGKAVSLDQLCQETGVSDAGCTAGDIMRGAKRHGLNCRGFRTDAAKLLEMNAPVIIHWDNCHFVVLERTHGDCVYINDPARGKITTNFETLQQHYSNVVLTFEILC